MVEYTDTHYSDRVGGLGDRQSMVELEREVNPRSQGVGSMILPGRWKRQDQMRARNGSDKKGVTEES